MKATMKTKIQQVIAEVTVAAIAEVIVVVIQEVTVEVTAKTRNKLLLTH